MNWCRNYNRIVYHGKISCRPLKGVAVGADKRKLRVDKGSGTVLPGVFFEVFVLWRVIHWVYHKEHKLVEEKFLIVNCCLS